MDMMIMQRRKDAERIILFHTKLTYEGDAVQINYAQIGSVRLNSCQVDDLEKDSLEAVLMKGYSTRPDTRHKMRLVRVRK